MEDVSGSLSDDLDAEYFKWQQEEESKEEPKKKGAISSLFGKK